MPSWMCLSNFPFHWPIFVSPVQYAKCVLQSLGRRPTTTETCSPHKSSLSSQNNKIHGIVSGIQDHWNTLFKHSTHWRGVPQTTHSNHPQCFLDVLGVANANSRSLSLSQWLHSQPKMASLSVRLVLTFTGKITNPDCTTA